MGVSTNSEALTEFIQSHQPLLVITGAGCSAASGIPTYRDDCGVWQRSTPIQHNDFVSSFSSRQRYWTRSLAGWPAVANAKPNACHHALARLEKLKLCSLLVTQNVDRLHQRSGQEKVIDLHGRLDRVHCLDCLLEITRDEMQARLRRLNPNMNVEDARLAPDGDAEVEDELIEALLIPDCDNCGGILKPSVVFYGGGVPKATVNQITARVNSTAGVLVLGSSLMVFSSFRFCRQAARLNTPITIVNAGSTRADDLASLKIDTACEVLLPEVVRSLKASL
ncbi:MAG: NAD-dependent SIR2 family protein deacetylase [Patiriisocius sp.]|jgi:NAD-dependent SIR2 family protein deacetylase